ncbi:diguanylate cyclase [Nitrosococcus halophilus Nc 4]|uniref:Diguanylate cyclase n=1 Tax=Nitrosococcus halophilus (strain Nc4) TaxID=472759 RepID=D5C101_NITHN|nr:EAL domain-containing protein [Nitrosococcus halophilus]ADE14558.1 diguanylate cyclase [Nitrosococcus halophilus Nc 4]
MRRLLRIFRGPIGFRQQLVLTFTIGILCLALFSSFAISTLSSRTVRTTLIEQGRRATETFATQSTLALLYQSADNAKEAANATLAFPDIQGVAIYDLEYQVLLSKGQKALPPGDNVQWPKQLWLERETEKAWYFVAPVYTRQGNTEQEESPFIANPPDPELIGFVRVVMGKDTLKTLATDILHGNLLVSIALAAVLLLVLLGITARITTPLRNLAETMRQAQLGEKQVRAEMDGPKDIMDMESAFNTMMTVLEAREQELKRARDAALESARIKGEFAANVSHELRTPLNGVLGMLELLRNMGLTPKQREYVQVACNSGETLLELIGNILDFSRIESGRFKLDPADFYLQEILDDAIGLLAGQAQRKDLDLGYVVAKNVPPSLRGDATRIRQILINLMGNAVKFTEQGEVSVEVQLLEKTAKKLVLLFEVKDTGIGIPIEFQKHIFEAFSQADSSTTRKYGGTGLGLAICRQLVDLMGGDIGVESKFGGGSRFWFTVPLEEAVALQERRDLNRANVAGLRLLIVDDSTVSRRFLEQTFSFWGMYHGSAENGQQALKMLRSAAIQGRAYDLALIDENMPGMEGVDLVHRIAESPQISSVKIILMGRQHQPTVDVSHLPGVVNYIAKPVQQSPLYNAIVTTVKQSGKGQPELPLAAMEEPSFANRYILVVEDNRVNQQVAVGMLKRFGCHVEVAANGQEALDLVARKSYDLVLMDCHMPRMDGYEATRRIRSLEAGKVQVPIIAMTANVREGDSDKCLSVGMNDYLPKPLRLNLLRDKLQYWLCLSSSSTTSVDSSGTQLESLDDETPLDPEVFNQLRASVGDTFSRMIEVFLEDTPIYLDLLRKAIIENGTKELRDMAHSIKGSAKNFGAARLASVAKQLEELGRSGSTKGARELLAVLVSEYSLVKEALQQEIQPESYGAMDKRPSRVLIVDDDRAMRMALRNVLEEGGYRIEEAVNGEQALAFCRRQMPDLVLMDAVMPLLDGFKACTQIRDMPGSRHTPVLIITALDDEHSIEQAFSAGATDYIPKPLHFGVLRQRVARLLDASRAEKHVHQLAYHDSLTGLPNRALFRKHLEKLLNRVHSEKRMFAILFLDLDRFKLVNDTLGHDVGDLLLKAAADRIVHCLRSGDMVARLGGDEFTVILEEISSSEVAEGVATKICGVLSKPFAFLGQEMYISTSIGISLYPNDGEDTSTLIKHADTAMFRAKEQGNSYQFYEEGMETAAARRLVLEADLRRALDKKEFTVCYQPQVELSTGKLIGMEALIRWHHPERGLVSPSEFIPLAEETGLIVSIGKWVLREACVQMQSWLRQGFGPFRIAVNVSGRELEKGDLVDKIIAVLEETGLSPELLELEITESVVMKCADAAIPKFRKLREMGIKLAIDDFGTGYSSLNYLKRFPVDTLKVDRCFVRDIMDNSDDAAIIVGIIALAHSLRLKVVAEGVETHGQEAFLKEHHCDSIQGFYLSQPLSANGIEQTILHRHRKGYPLSSKVYPLRTKGTV